MNDTTMQKQTIKQEPPLVALATTAALLLVAYWLARHEGWDSATALMAVVVSSLTFFLAIFGALFLLAGDASKELSDRIRTTMKKDLSGLADMVRIQKH